MNRVDLRAAVRRYARDIKQNIFTNNDLNAFINEAIYRVSSVPELALIETLEDENAEVKYMPKNYQYLLGLYAAARAFEQDERHYQAVQKMNEFEYKLEEFVQKIQDGTIVIVDEDGNEVIPESNYGTEYVIDIYHSKSYEELNEGK